MLCISEIIKISENVQQTALTVHRFTLLGVQFAGVILHEKVINRIIAEIQENYKELRQEFAHV